MFTGPGTRRRRGPGRSASKARAPGLPARLGFLSLSGQDQGVGGPLRGAPRLLPPRCGSSPGRASRGRHRRVTSQRRRGSSPGQGLPCQNLQSCPAPPQTVLYSGHSGQSAPRSAWTTESNSSNMANNESGAWNETIWVEMKGCGAAPVHHLDAVDALGRSVLMSDFTWFSANRSSVRVPARGPFLLQSSCGDYRKMVRWW